MRGNYGELTLALETSVGGGSISILEGDQEIDFWAGGEEFLKAKDFLMRISELLKKNKVSSNFINQIAVATGPGSFTGIRIGISMALGLKTAWNCRIAGVNILESLVFFASKMRPISAKNSSFYIPVIPFGKIEICWQLFQKFEREIKAGEQLVQAGEVGNLLKFLEEYDEFNLLVEDSLFQIFNEVKALKQKNVLITNVGTNLARLVGLGAKEGNFSNHSPVYLQR